MKTCTCKRPSQPYTTTEGVAICNRCGDRLAKPTAMSIAAELAHMREAMATMRADQREMKAALDAIAQAVIAPKLVTAEELAKCLSVSRSWIYLHADELGGKKINGAVRFDPKIAVEAAAPRPFRKREDDADE